MDKETATYIWNCIQNHAGDFSEDLEEWLDALEISREDMIEFELLVEKAIDSL